jgi:hypothetical protein
MANANGKAARKQTGMTRAQLHYAQHSKKRADKKFRNTPKLPR